MKKNFSDNNLLDDANDNATTIMPIFAEVEGNPDIECPGVAEVDLPILPLRNMVMYPGVALPVSVGRAKSLQLIKEAYAQKQYIGVTCQKDMYVDEPEYKDLYEIGTIAEIVKILEMPDGSTTVILQGKRRFHLDNLTTFTPYLRGNISLLEEKMPKSNDKEFEALISAIKDMTFNILKTLGEPSRELMFALRNIENSHYLINFLCSNIPLNTQQKQDLLNIDSVKQRAFSLYTALSKEAQLIEIKASIQSRTREDLNQQQREHFLQQQIKTIQDELGGSVQEQDIQELKEKASKKKWDASVAAIFEKELRKLERLYPQSPDFSVQYNYLETLTDLPWNEFTKDNFNLKHAQKQLDKDHYGLEKVKDRILEHLAVLKLRGDLKSPIICLYGPPGVGKTSLGKSIAEALKRKYVRISLGGLHDEAEIRGHRRTYIGAMPGRIIQGLLKAGSSNPVFVLDEIDKIGNDFKGDPASALLEVLDPEQNNAFHDNYLDIDYDLSNILFIATANNLNTISQPLLDRMELIDITGYILEEKVEIGRRHLVPKQLENHGLVKGDVDIPKKTMEVIVDSYTRESGVRELDKKIAKIMRKIARKKALEEEYPHTITVNDLHEYLGIKEYSRDKYEGNEYAGVVTGLAWTAVGGEILFVESSLSKSKGEKLTLTGNLGDVMKESAIIAMQYIKAHAEMLNISDDVFDKWNVHIHVPEGAIPKDGPSAGITMVTSIASSFTQRKVRPNLAMTGEITLRGRVLPVGGIKEKILAAKRANIKDIILSEENKKDIDEIKENYIKGLTFHYVRNIKEVLDFALLNEKVEHPIQL
ncbi:endopeptidase La [Coprobacter fastidiosus]|jgi:ATP-dependent Lon protease|uniref:endopeptidase La n=1 Tax=Coprobacter fastidiosus TaxID=1099853 RepID=UPI000240E608|nr:endopeptidase La [Coprobacter fastidiosus]EHL88177.1 lon protease [Tannerella sp. 6_1_58FAA_CT1]